MDRSGLLLSNKSSYDRRNLKLSYMIHMTCQFPMSYDWYMPVCTIYMTQLASRMIKSYDRYPTVTRSHDIWNPIHLDRIRQNRMYRYVPVCTGTYRYMQVQDFLILSR